MCGVGAVWTRHSSCLSLATISDVNTMTFPSYREGNRRRECSVRPDNKGAHSCAHCTLLRERTRDRVREELATRTGVSFTFYLKRRGKLFSERLGLGSPDDKTVAVF